MFGSNSVFTVLLLWIKIKNGVNQVFQWHLKPHIDRKQLKLYKAYVFYGKYIIVNQWEFKKSPATKNFGTEKTMISSLTFLMPSVSLLRNKRFSPSIFILIVVLSNPCIRIRLTLERGIMIGGIMMLCRIKLSCNIWCINCYGLTW